MPEATRSSSADPPRDRREPRRVRGRAAPAGGDARRSRRRARRAVPRRRPARGPDREDPRAGQPAVVGRFDVDAAGIGFVAPFDRRLQTDVAVPPADARRRAPGQMVAVEITRWPTATRGPIGRVTEVLGPPRRSGRRHDGHRPQVRPARCARLGGGRRGETPRRAQAAAPAPCTRAGTTRPAAPTSGAWTSSRSTASTRAISTTRSRSSALANGHFRLGVHIADVSHYVREGSALDAEAYERGTSVYFPDRALHMFPEELATGLCSLNPRVDRLVQSCLMEVDRHGTVVGHEFHDGIIRTRERMTYTDVDAILTGGDPVGGPVRPARADVRADARAVRDPQRPPAPAGLDRLRFRRGRGRARRGGPGRGDRRVRAEHRAPDHRGVHAARQRDGRGVPGDERRPRASTGSTSSPTR